MFTKIHLSESIKASLDTLLLFMFLFLLLLIMHLFRSFHVARPVRSFGIVDMNDIFHQ